MTNRVQEQIKIWEDKKKSEDIIKCYKVPESLQVNLRQLIDEQNGTPITDLQFGKYLKLIHRLSTKQHLNTNGYVGINAEQAQKELGKLYRSKFIGNLEKAGIIESLKDDDGRPKYSKVEQFSVQYRLTDSYKGTPLMTVEGIERVQKNKPKKDIADFNTKRMLKNVNYPEYKHLLYCLHQLTINVEQAEAACLEWYENGALIKAKKLSQKKYLRMLNDIAKLGGDTVKFQIKFGGRVFTFITLATKPIRQFIRLIGYGGVLMHSDLISAHILLAVPLMRSFKTNAKGREELNRVIEMIASKQFYQKITEELKAEGVRRVSKKR